MIFVLVVVALKAGRSAMILLLACVARCCFGSLYYRAVLCVVSLGILFCYKSTIQLKKTLVEINIPVQFKK